MVELFNEGKRQYYNVDGIKVYIRDNEGKKIYTSNEFIDISYNSTLIHPLNRVSCTLSNFFPHDFYFRHHHVRSVEGVLQGFKFKDILLQRESFKHYGRDAYAFGSAAFSNDWRCDGYLYFEGEKVDRFGIEYQKLLNELYVSLSLKKAFENNLIYTGNRVLLHSVGVLDPRETVLTTKEYILRLEILRECLKENKNPTQKLRYLAEVISEVYEEESYRKKFN
ncbi:MAG TPA: hypothetical protein GX725_03680 [Mollicutes bacterium]|nr:hypothetical protein [Mollicutes bacterium]